MALQFCLLISYSLGGVVYLGFYLITIELTLILFYSSHLQSFVYRHLEAFVYHILNIVGKIVVGIKSSIKYQLNVS